MKISPFLIERHFAKYEFEVPFQLSCSDCEPLTMSDLLSMANPESLSLWENLKFGYTDSHGHELLRGEIAQLYENVDVDDILVCVPEEGIFLVMNSFLEPGDHMVVVSPAYQSLYEVAQGIGCTVSQWKCGDDGTYHVESLKSLITPKTGMVVINFPHNPTGTHIDRLSFLEISRICEERGILLFSDEMYRGLEQDPNDRLPGAASLSGNNISLSGMSKSFALPGLRIGWLVCKNREVLEKMLQLKDYLTICASAPSEILAIIALQNKDEILARNQAIIAGNIRLVNDFVSRNRDLVNWNPPKTGSVGFLYLSVDQPVEKICAGLLEEKEVLAIGSHLFNYHRSGIRLGLGRAGFGEAVDLFEDFLKEHFDKGGRSLSPGEITG